MIYQGTVHDGVIVLPPDVRLPDGLQVRVQPISTEDSATELPAEWQGEMKNGVPVFPLNQGANPPNIDLVNELRDSAQ